MRGRVRRWSEVHEELGATIEVHDDLGTWPISETYELQLFLATVVTGAPSPGADHDELRWLAADELEDVEWLPSDLAALPTVRKALAVPR